MSFFSSLFLLISLIHASHRRDPPEAPQPAARRPTTIRFQGFTFDQCIPEAGSVVRCPVSTKVFTEMVRRSVAPRLWEYNVLDGLHTTPPRYAEGGRFHICHSPENRTHLLIGSGVETCSAAIFPEDVWGTQPSNN